MLVEARVVAVGDETRNGTEGVTPRKKHKGNKEADYHND